MFHSVPELVEGSLFFRLRPIDEPDLVSGTCEGRVEPTVVVEAHHLFCDVPLVDEHLRPLTALRLVAGDGIGVLDLQGVDVGVFLHLLHPIFFVRDIGVVLEHTIPQLLVHLMG